MELLQEKKSFVDEKLVQHEYVKYYVVVAGVNIYLDVKDSTAKALLKNAFEKGAK